MAFAEKALDKASADRNRAIQTLKFKAPDIEVRKVASVKAFRRCQAPEQRSLEDVAMS